MNSLLQARANHVVVKHGLVVATLVAIRSFDTVSEALGYSHDVPTGSRKTPLKIATKVATTSPRTQHPHKTRDFSHYLGFFLAFLLMVTAWAMADNALPPMLQGVAIEQRLDHQVPLNLKFKDESGADVELQKYFNGKPVILTLAYYECPMLCTEVLNGVVKAMKVLEFSAGKEFNVVTISFNPRETPRLAADKKQIYLDSYRRMGADHGWHFLTGTQDSIRRVTEAVGFKYKYDEAQQQFVHAAGIMVLTPGGRISRYLYGIEFSPRDLRLSLVEASEGKIGSRIDQALLFCFHYDPSTGKYSAAVLNFVRLGGILTVLSIGIFIITMKRREKRTEFTDSENV